MTARVSGLSPATQRQVRWVFMGAAIIGALIGLDTLLLHLREDPFGDAHAYYLAAQRLNAGVPLYHQPGLTVAETYLYPPLLATLFRPLALLPMDVALAVWEGVILIALLVLLRGARNDRRILVAAGILAMPIAWAVAIGQAEVVLAALLSLGTPFTVAFAGHLKIFPWLVGLYWLVTGDRRRFVRFVLWVGVLGAVQVVLEGAALADYLRFEWLQRVLDVRNFSLLAIHPVLYLGGVALVLAALFRFRRSEAAWPLAIALAIVAYPRLLLYQLMTLLAAFGGDQRARAGGGDGTRAT